MSWFPSSFDPLIPDLEPRVDQYISSPLVSLAFSAEPPSSSRDLVPKSRTVNDAIVILPLEQPLLEATHLPLRSTPGHPRTKSISKAEWLRLKNAIVQLYVHDELKLEDVKDTMKREFEFDATDQMYKKKFATWGIRKNYSREQKEDAIANGTSTLNEKALSPIESRAIFGKDAMKQKAPPSHRSLARHLCRWVTLLRKYTFRRRSITTHGTTHRPISFLHPGAGAKRAMSLTAFPQEGHFSVETAVLPSPYSIEAASIFKICLRCSLWC